MAKTTSQIVAENKIERAEAAAIAAARDQIHQQQMAQLVKQRSANANNEARKADHLAQMAAAAIAKRAEQNVTMPVQKSSAELRQEAQTARDAYEAERERAEQLRIAEAKKSATGSTYGAASQQEDNRKALEKAAGEVFANYGAKASAPEKAPDSKERELKAIADYYEAQKNTAEIQATTEQNLKELESWSEEDRNNLERYIMERAATQNNIFAEPAFDQYNLNPIVQKYGIAKVRKMAETLEWSYSQKLAEDTRKAAENANPVLGNIARVGTNLAGAVTAPIEYAREMANRTGQYATLNPNNIGTIPNIYGSTVLQETSAKIKGDGTSMLRNLAAVGYQGGMSILDNLARIAVSGGSASVSAAIAASGSFGNGLQQYSAQGADPGQAAVMAFADAGLEYVTEKLSDAEVLAFYKGGSKPEMIKKFLWQTFGVEPLSEEVNLFAGIAAEAAILGDKAEMNQKIGEMVANGMSYEEASREAWRQVWEEAKQTYAVSAISGAGQSAAMKLAGNIARDMKAKVDARNGVQPQQTAAQPEAEVTAEAPQEPQTQPVSKEQMIANALGEATGQKPAQIDKPVRTQPVSSAFNDIVENRPATANTDNNQNDNIQIARPETLWNKRDGKDGWSENADHNSVWATALAMREVNPDYFNQYMHDAEGEHTSAVIDAVINAANDVRQDTISPMAAATVINEVYSKYGESGLKQMYNPRNGNLYDSVLQRMKTVDSQHRPVDIDLDENGRNTALTGRTVTVVENSRSAQGQIQGTGAAERGFTPKQALINEYGNIPEGENPVRPDQMPMSTNGNDRVSYTARTAVEARVTPDEFVPLIENETVRGGFSYIPIRNDQTVQTATQNIAREGWQTARANWTAQIRAGVSSPEITATGALLYNHAVNAGDHQEAMDILMDYQMAVRNTAQALQAARILKTLKPSDRLYMITRAVDEMTREMKLEKPVKIDEKLAEDYVTAETQEEADRVLDQIEENVAEQIPPTLMERFTALRYLNMLGNFRTQFRNILGNTGAKMVYGFKDKVGAVVEILANKATGGAVGRTKSLTTDPETVKAAREDFANVESWAMGESKFGDKATTESEFVKGVKDKQRLLPPGLEEYRRATEWAMEKGDKIFLKDAYARALAGFLKANGVNAEQFQQMLNDEEAGFVGTPKPIIPNGATVYAADRQNYGKVVRYNANDNTYLVHFVSPSGHEANVTLSADVIRNTSKDKKTAQSVPKPEQTQEFLEYARDYAVRQAQEQTFRDNNQISDFVSGIMRGRNTPTWARMLGEGIMPFRRTPANVLVRAEEYSPLGLINSTVNTIRAARGEISGADLVDSWAKTLTGTALTAIGYGLANLGVLSGGPDEDEEKDEFDQLNGKQDYSLKFTVDGKTYSYTIDWATPAAMPLFLGAQLQKVFSKEGLTWADAEKAFTSIADPMIQMSMLQGVNDTLENIRYAENNMGQFLINATMSYLTQGLTNTLLGQIERSTEETRQTTYVDKDSNVPDWLQRQLGKASQKIPGWDYQQTDYLNAWGEAEENEGGLLYNMLSPGYLSEEQKSAVSNELYRLREATGENVFPQPAKKTVTYTGNDGTLHKDYNLTAEQFEKRQKTEGQEAAKLIADLVGNADFAKLTDNQKAGVIRDVYAYAAEQGKKAALEDYHSNADEWIQNMGSDKAGALIRRSVVNTLNNAISQTMSNMQNGWKTTPAAEAEREELYDSYKAMSAAERRNIREDADSNTANYLEARDAGVDHDEFVRVAQSLYNIKPERGNKNARTVQQAEAISRTAGISEREKELFIKQQVSDAQDKNIDDLKKLWREADDLKGQMTMSTYAKLYRDYEDYTKGDGKKDRTAEKWAKEYGISKNTAKALYDIFNKK